MTDILSIIDGISYQRHEGRKSIVIEAHKEKQGKFHMLLLINMMRQPLLEI